MKSYDERNEIFPLGRVTEADERMMRGKARFRVVLTMENQEQCIT
jgi:D-arabinose 1-dehydrogenase-like Zn-dependent alcohol dehydrogenase